MTIYIVLLFLWILPVIVAAGRGVRVRTIASIASITLVLGFTIIGWVFALIWSLEAPRDNF